MGFFSSNCEGCGHPLLSSWVINKINSWMEQAVIITPDGKLHAGSYDGYGSVDGGVTQPLAEPAMVWHKACWEVAGKPTEYEGESTHSEDQGYFYNDPDHDMPEPSIARELDAALDTLRSTGQLDANWSPVGMKP